MNTGIQNDEKREIPFGRRKTDLYIDPLSIEQSGVVEPGKMSEQRHLLIKVLWERSKGELNGIIACCDSAKTNKHAEAIIIKAREVQMMMDSIIYEWNLVK